MLFGALLVAAVAGSIWVAESREGGQPAPPELTNATSGPHSPSVHYLAPPEQVLTKSTLAEAQKQLSFDPILPEVPEANPDSLTGAYVDGAGVYLDFPPIQGTTEGVRTPFPRIFETLRERGSAQEAIDADVKGSPDVGKSECVVAGSPAVCVTANSPDDVEKANPAFIRFFTSDLEVTVSGGNDLGPLRRIANSVARQG